MRLALAYIDTIQPYPVISHPNFLSDSGVVRINWELNGCLTIDQMNLETLLPDQSDFDSHELLDGTQGF